MSRRLRGDAAEERAAAELERRGYRVLQRNYRCRLGEIDIVAADGDALVFVEVRSRGSGASGSALESVDLRKQRQIARVAQHYLGACGTAFERVRFDVVGITGDELVIATDAFRLDDLA